MSPASDDPPTDRVSAGPTSAPPAASGESEPAGSARPRIMDEEVKEGTNTSGVTRDNSETPTLPRPRRRRRRRRPRGLGVADAVASGQNEHEKRAAVGDAPQPGEFQAEPSGGGDIPRRRRRRNRSTRSEVGTGGVTAGQEVQSAEGAPPFGPSSARRGAEPGAGDGAQSATTPNDSAPRAQPGRRRRRRKPPPAAVSIGETASGAETPPEGSAPTAVALAQNAAQQGAPEGGGGSQLGKLSGRRRRRRFPRSAATTPAGEHQASGRPSGESTLATEPGRRTGPYRELRSGGSRDGRGRNEGTEEGKPRDAGQGEREPGRRPREITRSRPDGREQGSRGRQERRKGAPGPKDRRGRDVPQKRPEPRLYALESVVDRGFDDVPDEADSAIRRVHWTITKRTVADQQSGKPISATYVLKRDGVDTEFPSLGTARAAANKTIVHPEKLTLSKAEHAAAKK